MGYQMSKSDKLVDYVLLEGEVLEKVLKKIKFIPESAKEKIDKLEFIIKIDMYRGGGYSGSKISDIKERNGKIRTSEECISIIDSFPINLGFFIQELSHRVYERQLKGVYGSDSGVILNKLKELDNLEKIDHRNIKQISQEQINKRKEKINFYSDKTSKIIIDSETGEMLKNKDYLNKEMIKTEKENKIKEKIKEEEKIKKNKEKSYNYYERKIRLLHRLRVQSKDEIKKENLMKEIKELRKKQNELETVVPKLIKDNKNEEIDSTPFELN